MEIFFGITHFTSDVAVRRGGSTCYLVPCNGPKLWQEDAFAGAEGVFKQAPDVEFIAEGGVEENCLGLFPGQLLLKKLGCFIGSDFALLGG